MMLNGDSRDSFVYQYLTIMIDSFFLCTFFQSLELNHFDLEMLCTLKCSAFMSAILTIDIIFVTFI